MTRVIVLDDNPDMLGTMKLMLERHGLEVVTCVRAAAALRAQGERPADALRKPFDPEEFLRLLTGLMRGAPSS